MNPDDIYVKKIPTYNIIQYTGDNREEVVEFLASRGCTQYISSPEGDIYGTYEGMPPYFIRSGEYIAFNLLTKRAEIYESVDGFEIKQ